MTTLKSSAVVLESLSQDDRDLFELAVATGAKPASIRWFDGELWYEGAPLWSMVDDELAEQAHRAWR